MSTGGRRRQKTTGTYYGDIFKGLLKEGESKGKLERYINVGVKLVA